MNLDDLFNYQSKLEFVYLPAQNLLLSIRQPELSASVEDAARIKKQEREHFSEGARISQDLVKIQLMTKRGAGGVRMCYLLYVTGIDEQPTIPDLKVYAGALSKWLEENLYQLPQDHKLAQEVSNA